MNQYGTSMKNAKTFADNVLLIKKNHFLDNIPAEAICLDESSYIPEITQWYKLKGFRLKADNEHTNQEAARAVTQWLRSSNVSGNSSAFVIVRNGKMVSVLYGTGRAGTADAFSANLPECRIERTEWSQERYHYNGIILGTVSADRLADTIAGANEITNGFVSCVAIPAADSEIQNMIMDNRRKIAYLDKYKSFQRVYGNATRRVEEISIDNVFQAIDILKEENDFLEYNRGEGFFRTIVKFGAMSHNEYNTIAALIQSCIRHNRERQLGFEPVRCFEILGGNSVWESCLAIPCVRISNSVDSWAVHTVTLQSMQSAASFCMPPLHSYEGYYIQNYHVDENEQDAFALTEPITEDYISVGRVIDNRSTAGIPIKDLLCHTAVFGATNSGKTTTVMKILDESYRKNKIPFVVIEAAKKEYASLIEHIPELRVYTSGNDGMPLLINPLQPEDGILIENHVAAVVRSLMAAAGGEHPIPEAYEGLLKQTYSRCGWEYGMMAYTDSTRPFPTFKDVLDNVELYIEEHARYGPEVRQNLTAALKLRSEAMHSGALGRMFAEPVGLMAKDLLSVPSVIELADFPEESTAFLMNILLFKFQSYLSRLPVEGYLKRLIVVEEAHNILKNTISEDSGRALNNNAFEKMLAEIRSSGTGLILSDQRPSIMPEAVIANTAVKIIHSMESKEDREIAGEPIGLTEFQRAKIRNFSSGECIISLRGHYGVQHVTISAVPKKSSCTAACLICTSRFRCRRSAVQRMLEKMDTSKVAFHVAKICSNPYNAELLAHNITFMLRDLNVTAADSTKCCLLGEILSRDVNISFQESRIIVNSYAEYLRRGV